MPRAEGRLVSPDSFEAEERGEGDHVSWVQVCYKAVLVTTALLALGQTGRPRDKVEGFRHACVAAGHIRGCDTSPSRMTGCSLSCAGTAGSPCMRKSKIRSISHKSQFWKVGEGKSLNEKNKATATTKL